MLSGCLIKYKSIQTVLQLYSCFFFDCELDYDRWRVSLCIIRKLHIQCDKHAILHNSGK